MAERGERSINPAAAGIEDSADPGVFMISRLEMPESRGVVQRLRDRLLFEPYSARAVTEDGKEIVIRSRTPGELGRALARHTDGNGRVIEGLKFSDDSVSDEDRNRFYRGLADS